MIKSNWNVKIKGQGLSVNEIFSKFWRNRGVSNPTEFLSPDYYFINPAAEMKNMKTAANVFIDAINNGSNILVYADVDTDGCSSAAIIKHYIDKLGFECSVCINKGKAHGIQKETLEGRAFDLLIVVDSINDDTKIYEELIASGKQIIVLDHHIPKQDVLTIAEKINLVSSAVDYINPNLSGSGVCWKFVSYIDELTGNNYADELLDLAATGIVADVCSLGADSMENRAICNIGFRMINNVGLKTIVGKESMTSTDIGFSVGPLVNAANRMNENELALELFLTTSPVRAKEIIKDLTKLKEKQKKLTQEIVDKLTMSQLNSQVNNKFYYFIVGDDCENLAGLIATRLSASYHRPVMVLHESTDKYAGSMRAEGVEDFSKIINESGCAECVGHENAAGVTIYKDKFSEFISYIKNALESITLETRESVDISLDRAQVTPFILQQVQQVNRISGAGFAPVTFLIENVNNYELTKMSNGKHLCIKVPDMKFIKWNFTDSDKVPENGRISFIGTLEESAYGGRKTVNMMIEDFAAETTPRKTSLW